MHSLNPTSQGAGMPNIDSLISRAADLERSYNSWNHAYIVLGIVTAIVTGLLIVTTAVVQWTASRKAGELNSAKDDVIRAKDQQLKEEFAHRDVRIAGVHADDWQARRDVEWADAPATPKLLIPTIKITIAVKPNAYFFPPDLQNLLKQREQAEERVRQIEKEAEARVRQSQEEYKQRLREHGIEPKQ